MSLPTDRMPADLRAYSERLTRLERDLRELRASKPLEHSSIDGGALTVRDQAGNVRAVIGNQNDGTVAVVSVAGPVPPTPTDPVVTAELAALGVTWDGEFVGGVAAPADWLRCEIHVGAAADFTPDQTTLRQTIETAAGATVLVPLGYTEWFIKLRSMSTSGVPSAPTTAVSGTPRQAGVDDIEADAITGKVITGGTIQTSEGDPSLVITDDGFLRVYNSSSDITTELGGPTGALASYSQTGVTGNFRVEQGIVYLGDPAVGTEANLFAEVDSKTTQLLGNTVTGSSPLRARFKSSPTRPQLALDSGSGGTLPADLAVSGYVFNGTTWQTPSYAANWLASTTFGSSSNWVSLRYRIDAEDNLWIIGAFKSNTTAPGLTVFQLPNTPINYRPSGQYPVLVQQRTVSSGALVTGYAQITGSGNFNILTASGLSVGASIEYLVNAKVPLGNLA